MFNINKYNLKITFGMGSFFLLLLLSLSACDFSFELPDANSIPDETPPSASFSATQNEGDFMTFDFTNLSASATDYVWDFGDGNSSTDADPSNTYGAEGTYTVTLTATDKLNVSSTTTQTVEVVEPENDFVPVILNPSFDEEGEDSFRDNWRNGDLGGVIQITSSPTHTPEKAAKLPSAGDRIGYQLITVLPDTDYNLTFYYTMKTDPVGTITVRILAGAVSDPAEIEGKTIASFVGTDQSGASDYVQASLQFNSGDNSEVAIFFQNEGVECRIDTFEIMPL